MPIASRFDLIIGTSIGGILALALALEIPAQRMVDLFVEHGSDIFKRRWSLCGFLRAPYSQAPLQNLLSDDARFGQRLLGECRHPGFCRNKHGLDCRPCLLRQNPRQPTRHGEIVTQRITDFLVQKQRWIVNGLALGCDSIAHSTCVAAGGKTIAVLAHGLHTVANTRQYQIVDSQIRSWNRAVPSSPSMDSMWMRYRNNSFAAITFKPACQKAW